MFSFWRLRRSQPPSPTVEDEVVSLARELHAVPCIIEKPGLEGVHCRGSIDQYPVLLAVRLPQLLPPTAESRVTEVSDDSPDKSASSSTSSMSAPNETAPRSETSTKSTIAPAATQSRNKENSIESDLSRGQQSGHQAHPQTLRPLDTKSANNGQKRAPSRNPSSNTEKRTFPQRDVSVNGSHSSSRPLKDLSVASQNQLHRQEGKASTSRDSKTSRSRSVKREESQRPVTNTKAQKPPMPSHNRVQDPPQPKTALQPHQSNTARSNNGKHESSTERPVANQKVSITSSKGPLNSVTSERKETSDSKAQVGKEHSTQCSKVASLSERLEEKLRHRRELQESKDRTENDAQSKSDPKKTKMHTVQAVPAKEDRAPQPVVPVKVQLDNVPATATQTRTRDSSSKSRESSTHASGTISRSRATSTSPKLKPASGSSNKDDKVAGTSCTTISISQSSPPSSSSKDEATPKPGTVLTVTIAQPTHSRRTRSQTVTLPHEVIPKAVSTSEKPLEVDKTQLRSHSCQRDIASYEMEMSTQFSPGAENLCLLPCPRAIPMAGYQDWYTIKGMPYLDICPSCTQQLVQSKFREFFIPGPPKPRGQKVRCSFSEPWTRLAWVQAIKKDCEDLKMLHQITHPPQIFKPCPGRITTEQYWYRIIDPETDTYLPRFSVCPTCIRNLRILMPSHRDTFERSPTPRERLCDLATSSPRFVQYIDLLDAAATRAELSNSPLVRPVDMDPFLAYARRKVVLRDCPRDRLIFSNWHYLPQLPEFTVCEDCFDDVVWPLVKANYPIARMFSTRPQLLPGDGLYGCREASCQLYSPRMRVRFRDAVLRDSFLLLEQVALTRYNAERKFRERKLELLDEDRRGFDRDAELRVNGEEWRKWE